MNWKRWITGCLTLMILATAPMQAGVWDFFSSLQKPRSCPPVISVLIVQDRPGVILEVKGPYRLYNPSSNSFLSTRFMGKRKFIQPLNDGLRWGEVFPGLHQLIVVPDRMETTSIVDGIEYRGSIYAYDVEGSLAIVNEIDIEEYLQSLLSSQDYSSFPQEALAAIAIAARTNSYYSAGHPPSNFWAVDAANVGYRGYAVTNPQSSIAQAIIATRYMAMHRQDTQGQMQPFPAHFGHPDGGIASRISLQEVAESARKGMNAAQILEKAFPNSVIVLTYRSDA